MTLTVYSIDGATPVVDPTAYVHPSAVLIGDVIVGPGCYVGPTACLRGDFGRLEMRAGSNVQDGCILHAYPGNEHARRGGRAHRARRDSPRLHGQAQRARRHECRRQRQRRDRRVGDRRGAGLREGRR